MKWCYDLTGAEPIIKDEPVYDATTISLGMLLMLGTTDPDSGADEGISLVRAWNISSASTAIDAVGIALETVTTASSISCAAAYSTATGPCYAKVIINPFAVYEAEQKTDADNDTAITSTSTTTLTVPSLADDIDGCFAYFPLTASGVKGSLRFITAAASGSCTMDSALTTTGTNTDTVCIISPRNRYSTNLTNDASYVTSLDCLVISGATNLRVVETIIDRDGGKEVMEPVIHKGLNNLHLCKGGNGPKFYNHIVMKDCLFGVQE